MRKASVLEYLKTAQEQQIIPNFFLSESYLSVTESYAVKNSDWIWIMEDALCLFPPLALTKFPENYPVTFVWSDFGNLKGEGANEFLDWEYIYRSTDFLNLVGKKWSTFRKNIRKWPRRNGEKWRYVSDCSERGLEKLLIEWLTDKKETAQEPELIAEYLLNGRNRVNLKLLFSQDRLMGVNAWDENYHYINYRYCLTRNESFLDEFCRYLFYTDPEIINKNKLVNDGGSLGNPSLEKFKDKLNPYIKREVNSWTKKTFNS